jgi:aldehyde dehydrogenase (NAD+)
LLFVVAAFHNMYNHIISCLFAGNGIVLKMSEFSCFTVDRMLRIARASLASQGHDPNLIGAVNGFAGTGRAVVALTDKVIFTGSPGVGRLVMESAAKSLTPVVLELGGKDPVVICEDAAVDDVLPIVLRGTFQGAGQNCIGIERVLVYERIYASFVDKAAVAVKALRQGPPLTDKGEWNDVDMGATTTAAQAEHVLRLVDSAVKAGALLHCGGKINRAATAAAGGGGVYVEPTLLSNVTHDMEIFKEEVFGPVMCIIKVEDDNDAEARRLCNAVQYGLGSNVYSKDIPRAERLGRLIHAGMTNINDMALNYMAQSLPFGGVKNSGFGRFAGIEGLRECCVVKSVTSGKPTILPMALRYPISPASHRFIGGMMDSFYGTSLVQRAVGVVAMMGELGVGGILEQMS